MSIAISKIALSPYWFSAGSYYVANAWMRKSVISKPLNLLGASRACMDFRDSTGLSKIMHL